MKTILRISTLALALVAAAYGQRVTLTQTTLSSAAASSDTVIQVASATGMTGPSASTPRSMLYVIDPGSMKGEAMYITSISGTNIGVARGVDGTKAMAHVTSSLVLIGKGNDFKSANPDGGCTTASTSVTPWVNVLTGQQWLCSTVTKTWVPGWNNQTAPAGVTTLVASQAGATLASGPLFHMNGTNAITSFTTPIGFSGGTMCAIPDAAFTTTATNNIGKASTAVAGKPLCWIYDSNAGLWYPNY